jgi:hypothetical protein
MIPTKFIPIRHCLKSKAPWRRKIHATYPDGRNITAAELLEQLAAEDITADAIAKVESIRSFDLNRAAAEIAHRIGFWYWPESLNEYVDLIVEQVAKNRAEIDAVFSVKG